MNRIKNIKLIETLEKAGMPFFWQSFALFHAFVMLVLVFIPNLKIKHGIDLLIIPLVTIGVIAGMMHHKHRLYPWVFLLSAVAIIGLSGLLKAANFFGLAIDLERIFWIEEFGITCVGFFGLSLMLAFESRYRVSGFVIDFCLLVISAVCLIFLISADFLDVFIRQYQIQQKIYFIHAVLGVALFVLAVLNLKLVPTIKLKDIVVTLLAVFISSHLLLDSYVQLFSQGDASNLLLERISWSLYQLSGTMAIFTVFTEKLDLEYDIKKTKVITSRFLRVASISALLVIPIGVIYRWKNELSMIEPFLLASASVLLSTVVILRFTLLIKKTESQSKKLKSIAFTDPLTGLSNFLGYRHSMGKQANLLVITINIEDFKSINDMHNRQFGDRVLKSLGKRLASTPKIIFAARTNGDNFIAVFRTSEQYVENTAENLAKHLGVWDTIMNRRIAVPLTMGASHSTDPIEPEELVRQAEVALKVSRQQHRNFTLYSKINKKHSILSDGIPRHELREILQQAIDRNYLPVFFQPIYDVRNGSLRALELLIRVQSKRHGILMPSQFLDQAKAYGMLTELTKVCIKMVSKHYPQLPEVQININVPPYMLNNADTLHEFINTFKILKLPTRRFCIEVTEDGDIPTENLIPAVRKLKDHGFSIAMDDFGTGYSSLSRLSALAVDSVKIDRSLLVSASAGNKAILESAISLVKRLGVNAVVEGVETIEQLKLVKQLGADSVQGFLFAKPQQIRKTNQFSLNATDIIAEF